MKKIMFIDDDKDFLAGQVAFFKSRGFEVLTATNGEEALKLLRREVPSIIFIDLMMEHYDSGFNLSHKIKGQKHLQHVPLVMISGVASTTGKRFDGEEEAMKRWCDIDGFLDKPLTGRQILKVIEEKTGKQ